MWLTNRKNEDTIEIECVICEGCGNVVAKHRAHVVRWLNNHLFGDPSSGESHVYCKACTPPYNTAFSGGCGLINKYFRDNVEVDIDGTPIGYTKK